MFTSLSLALLLHGAVAAVEPPPAVRALRLNEWESSAAIRREYLGLTQQEVLDRKGSPRTKNGDTWTYCPLHAGFMTHLHITTITFRDGRVVQVRHWVQPVGCMAVKPLREE